MPGIDLTTASAPAPKFILPEDVTGSKPAPKQEPQTPKSAQQPAQKPAPKPAQQQSAKKPAQKPAKKAEFIDMKVTAESLPGLFKIVNEFGGESQRANVALATNANLQAYIGLTRAIHNTLLDTFGDGKKPDAQQSCTVRLPAESVKMLGNVVDIALTHGYPSSIPQFRIRNHLRFATGIVSDKLEKELESFEDPKHQKHTVSLLPQHAANFWNMLNRLMAKRQTLTLNVYSSKLLEMALVKLEMCVKRAQGASDEKGAPEPSLAAQSFVFSIGELRVLKAISDQMSKVWETAISPNVGNSNPSAPEVGDMETVLFIAKIAEEAESKMAKEAGAAAGESKQ